MRFFITKSFAIESDFETEWDWKWKSIGINLNKIGYLSEKHVVYQK